jgi:hypothetical protein
MVDALSLRVFESVDFFPTMLCGELPFPPAATLPLAIEYIWKYYLRPHVLYCT